MIITVGGRDASEPCDAERARQREAAAQRVVERTTERRAHEATLARPGGIAAADTPERIAKRVDRLASCYGYEVAGEATLEKIINTAGFVGIRYLDAGVAAARAIGRVNIRGAGGRLQGYGTGSLVSPALLLTNHHVLPDAETARHSAIEFNFQDGLDGRPLLAQVFPLDPDRFFLADEERDCALVAVRAAPDELAPFGFNRLIEAEGKAIIGEFVTIVQHPRGEKKQVALRENKIVDIPERFPHYTADTEPGSSGSLAFNDQWEPVALHHASVPSPEHRDLGGFVNEGIRISRIVQFVKDQPLTPEQRALADAMFAPAGEQLAAPAPLPAPAPVAAAAPPRGEMTITVPLEITVRVSYSGGVAPQAEASSIDPDYSSRGGYDAAFLAVPLPLPVPGRSVAPRSEEHTSELQSHSDLVCRLLLEKKKKIIKQLLNKKKKKKKTKKNKRKKKK